jgi:hypothetical protein
MQKPELKQRREPLGCTQDWKSSSPRASSDAGMDRQRRPVRRAKGDTVRVPGYGQIPTGATDSRAPTWIFPTQVGTWASGSIEDTEGWGSGLSVTLESELGMIATRETDWLEQRRATLAKKKAKDL